jgi:hypothetical protein
VVSVRVYQVGSHEFPHSYNKKFDASEMHSNNETKILAIKEWGIMPSLV